LSSVRHCGFVIEIVDTEIMPNIRDHRRRNLGLVFVILSVATFAISRFSWGPDETAIRPDFIPATAHFERSGAVLLLDVATSTEARTKGLSGRENLPENTALLMVFPEDGTYGIWMKDMLFAIDVLWIDSRGVIVDFVERMAPETYPQAFVPTREVRYVIEASAGFVAEHGIGAGERVLFE